MKWIFPTISFIAAILALGLTLSGLYIAFWQDLAVVPIGLAMIGAGAVSGILSVAALLAAILSKMAPKI
jgi:hypothetical protein